MPLKTQRDDEISINMTPMIDIVFLLIIFFLLGPRFTEMKSGERDIQLNVPEVNDATTLVQAPGKKVINIFHDGRVMLDKESLSLDELQLRLVQAKLEFPGTGVIVRGDANSLYKHVAEVIATCREAKITDLNIAVKPVELR